MRRRVVRSLILLVLGAASLPVVFGSAVPVESASLAWVGQVTLVEDGDTFRVDVNGVSQHIRVAGINTNEVNRDPACYADEATARLKSLIEGRRVELRANEASSTADGRLIRHVFYNGVNVAELLLEEGYGAPIVFLEQGEVDYAESYLRAYARARRAGVGIHVEDRCGVGPAASAEFSMTTNGDADGSDFANVNGEFVRIRNTGLSVLQLDGWQLKDSALEFYAFPDGTAVQPGQSLTVRVGVGTDTSSTVFMGRTSPIFSGVDGSFLLDPDGDLRAQNTWPCVGLCGEDAVPSVSIVGLNFDIPGNDDLDPNGEWFDLRNDGFVDVDLQDWRFESFPHSKVVDQSIVIPPGETVRIRIGQGADSATTIHMNRTGSILNNTGDVVLAVTPAGDVAACQSFGDADCRWHPSKSATMRVGADFNGDGWSDAVGRSPGESVGSVANAGAVLVRYGRDQGIRTDQPVFGVAEPTTAFLSQFGRITGGAETGDEFGAATAAGDFNGDGYDDLAIGAPGEAVGSRVAAGVVHLILGGPSGLDVNTEVIIQQGGIAAGGPEAGDRFGSALGAGDTNGDGRDDLVIGVPGENGSSGYVLVLLGSANHLGIDTGSERQFSQFGSIAGTPEPGDLFGSAIAVGDLNGDGYADLAVGAPGEDFGSMPDPGIVHVLSGSSSGLSTSGDQTLSQGGGIVGTAEPGDLFGASLAIGDLDGDGIEDLALGAPGEAVGSRSAAGAVIVGLSGTPGGGRWLAQGSGIPGYAETGDQVGYALAVADLDNDGVDDLVVGAPREDIGSRADAGLVSVVFGPLGGALATASFAQSDALAGWAERGDMVGSSLDVLDHDGDGHADVLIGVAGEDLGSISDAGLVHLVRGSDAGTGSISGWTQADFSGGVEAGDRFGA